MMTNFKQVKVGPANSRFLNLLVLGCSNKK
jgi:hypothetical protein